jgi:hypothetical protein
MRRFLTLLTLSFSLVLGPLASSAPAAPYCGITWGSLPKTVERFSTGPVVAARTGQHACFDRFVVEVDGSAPGYNVNYTPFIYQEGSGEPIPAAGGAKIQVTVLAGVQDNEGNVVYPYRDGDRIANVRGYRTFRDAVYAGSFEGYTSFGLGVRARLPFRVFTLSGPGGHSRLVIDVAHQW